MSRNSEHTKSLAAITSRSACHGEAGTLTWRKRLGAGNTKTKASVDSRLGDSARLRRGSASSTNGRGVRDADEVTPRWGEAQMLGAGVERCCSGQLLSG
jgi:hypothetical protein